MSLSLNDRMKLASQASEELAVSRLAEADAKMGDGIQWVLCPCDQCATRRSEARLLMARPSRRKRLGILGVLLIAASALAVFLILEAGPILRALNY